MIQTRLVGYWGPEYIEPQQIIGGLDDLPDAEFNMVVGHLENGREVTRQRGPTWCRFGCKSVRGCSELSDGYWAWPVDLVHYVTEHNISLPPSFVRSILEGLERDKVGKLSLDFWQDWCLSMRDSDNTICPHCKKFGVSQSLGGHFICEFCDSTYASKVAYSHAYSRYQ